MNRNLVPCWYHLTYAYLDTLQVAAALLHSCHRALRVDGTLDHHHVSKNEGSTENGPIVHSSAKQSTGELGTMGLTNPPFYNALSSAKGRRLQVF
jgi:hypothetical protein